MTLFLKEVNQVYRPSEEEVRGYIDPYENVTCVECQQGTGLLPSPRHALGGDFQVKLPLTGNVATTLSGRRRIRHRVHGLLSSTRMNEGTEMASRTDGTSQVNFGSEFGNCEHELGKDNTSCSMQEVNAFGASFGHPGRHNNEGSSTATLTGPSGALCVEDAEVDAVGLGQIHQCSSTNANVSHSRNSNLASFQQKGKTTVTTYHETPFEKIVRITNSS